jgi:DNA repair photolyase
MFMTTTSISVDVIQRATKVLTESGKLVGHSAQAAIESLVDQYRPLTNPYLAISLMAELARHAGYPRVAAACDAIEASRLLHEEGGRRIPLLEVTPRVIKPASASLGLAPEETELVSFAARLSFEYPGVVGQPTAPLALKRRLAPGFKPFADAGQVLDSQRLAGPDGLNTSYLVSQMKGGMSVDYGIGCPLMCAYCYRREGDTVESYLGSWAPKGFLEAHEAVERLLSHPWFTPHVTPIGLHMSTSEAFIPQNWPRTLGTLRLLDSLGLTNRVSCITKHTLNDAQIAELESLKCVDLDVNVCYANMPVEVEPPNRQKRIDFLRRISMSKSINVLAYFRPIAEGINTTDEHFREVWEVFRDAKVRVVVLGGLKFSDDHLSSFMSYGLPVPEGTFTAGKKTLTADAERRIMRIFDEVYAGVREEERPAVLKRSSCGRVVVRGSHIPDYNAHWDLPEHNCKVRCPLAQHEVCAAGTPPTSSVVAGLMERLNKPTMPFTITSRSVIISGPINQFERTFLRQNVLFPVVTDLQFVDAAVGVLR